MCAPPGRSSRRHAVLPLFATLASFGCQEGGRAQPPVRPSASPSGPSAALPGPEGRASRSRLADAVRGRGRALTVRVSGGERVGQNDQVDVLVTLPAGAGQGAMTALLLQYIFVLARPDRARLTLLVLPEEGAFLAHAEAVGTLHVARRHPEDVSVVLAARSTDATSLRRCALLRGTTARRIAALPRGDGPLPSRLPKGLREVELPMQSLEGVRDGDLVDIVATFPAPPGGEPVTRLLLEAVLVTGPVGPRTLGLLLLPEELASAVLVARIGTLHALLRTGGDRGTTPEVPFVGRAQLATGQGGWRCPDTPRAPKERINILRGLPGLDREPSPPPRARPAVVRQPAVRPPAAPSPPVPRRQ